MKLLKIYNIRKLKQSIFLQVVTKLTFTAVIVIAVSIIFIDYYTKLLILDSAKDKASFVSYSLEKAISPLIENEDIASIQRLIENSASFPFIRSIQLIDVDLVIQASNDHREKGTQTTLEIVKNVFENNLLKTEVIDNQKYVVVAPIRGSQYKTEFHNDIEWGLVINLDLEFEDGIIEQFNNIVTIQNFVLFSTLLIGMLIIIYRAIIRPFHTFVKATNYIAAGSFDHKISLESNNELGTFVHAFNSMTEELKIRKEKITGYMADLNERTARIGAIVNSAPDAIITTDGKGTIESFNPAAEHIFGYRVEEIIGRNINYLLPPLRRDRQDDLLHHYLDVQNQNLKSSRQELTAQKNDGTCFPIELTVSEMSWEDIHRFTCIIRDITEQKLAEEKERSAYKAGMAENAIAVLHNIGNAITPVGVSLNLLYKKESLINTSRYLTRFKKMLIQYHEKNELDDFLDKDPKGCQMIPFLGSVIENLNQFIEEERNTIRNTEKHITHISEIISLQQKYADFQSEPVVFYLSDVLSDTIEMTRQPLEARKITFTNIHDEESLMLKLDKNKLVQVLLNILKNAIESIDIELGRVPDKLPAINLNTTRLNDRQLQLIIEDNGAGIDKEHLNEVCKFGFTTKNRTSGFGLHDCANFVLANDGNFEIDSSGPGTGATVTLTLPLWINE